LKDIILKILVTQKSRNGTTGNPVEVIDIDDDIGRCNQSWSIIFGK